MWKKMSEIKKWEIAETLFIAIAGTLLHFALEWTDNSIAAIFAPVNESTWEHLKLLFMPALFFTLIQRVAIGREYPSLMLDKGKAVLIGLCFIIVSFYTYSGILGRNVTWIDILIFYLSVFIYTIVSYKNIKKEGKSVNLYLGILIFLILFLLFFIFTKNPPDIGLFWEP